MRGPVPHILCLAFVLPSLLLGATTAFAHDLLVGARTTVTVNAEARGTHVRIDGHLRDNVGQGVGGEEIRIDFAEARRPDVPVGRDVKTDRTGRFFLNLRLAPGNYTGIVYFSGREYIYSGAESALPGLKTDLSKVTLSIDAPTLTRGTRRSIPLRVAAISEGSPVPGLPVFVEVGGTRQRVVTGKRGIASLEIAPSEAEGGNLGVNVVFDGSADFLPARQALAVRVLSEPRLTLRADRLQARLKRGVLVEGAFADEHGPVVGKNVQISASQSGADPEHLVAPTDETGHFRLVLDEGDLVEGPLHLKAKVVIPRNVSLAAAPVSLTVSKRGFGFLSWILLAIVGLAAAGGGGITAFDWYRRLPKTRRRETAKKAKARISRARRPTIKPALSAARPPSVIVARDRIAGLVVDSQSEDRLTGALVEVLTDLGRGTDDAELPEATPGVQTSDDGHFEFGPLPSGSFVLRVSRPGYVSATYRFALPHGGALDYIKFPLTPVRVLVREMYAELVEDLAMLSDGGWGEHTPRQVYGILLDAVDAEIASEDPPEGLEAFQASLASALAATRGQRGALDVEELVTAVTHIIEEVYYSNREHQETMVTVTERLCERVRSREVGL